VNSLTQKILVVEDEEQLLALLVARLEEEGFRVVAVTDGEEAVRAMPDERPDLVILDLILPQLDGLSVCRWIRKNPETAGTPILIMSGRSEDIDKLVGFEAGADDFVTKPVSTHEVVARVKALLRRTSQSPPVRVLRAGALEVDIDRYRVTVAGAEVKLTSKEFELLRSLLEARGRALRREFLMEKVWGYSQIEGIATRTVDVHIRRLREKLGGEGRRILTVRNVGYRFETSPQWIAIGSNSKESD